MSSFEPSQCTDEMNASEEVSGGFFVARCNASEVLDCVEEPFDKVALGIERKITIAFDLAV